MNVISDIQSNISEAISAVFGEQIDASSIIVNSTKKEFDGDFTLVTFPFTKMLRKKPEEIGETLGKYLEENTQLVEGHNVIKGFLNLSLSQAYWNGVLKAFDEHQNLLSFDPVGKKVIVEYSSPNTNKPLHLGHIRNILLGWSVARILEYTGHEVVKTQIINDRGIAVCKSMYAWLHHADGATPESAGIKGDHFVGQYYVKYNQLLKDEYQAWQASTAAQSVFESAKETDKAVFFEGYKNKYFNEYSEIGKETKEMLLAWEAGDEETIALWKKMNDWVYQGFDITYEKLGVNFTQNYYESDTYLLGKKAVEKGLDQKIFFQKEDNSVWIDLEDEGMDQKLVLRADGTSVYMTQDLGTAQKRYEDCKMDSMVYVVGDEQDYHFKVLFKILKKLGASYADGLFHLSYGMVDLPTGKMKSREGTVVDADDLIKEVVAEAHSAAAERGENEAFSQEEKSELYRKIGLAALKFFIIKVNPKKRMTFDPKESVDMQGQTGPYIQNAFVRIQSILRRIGDDDVGGFENYVEINESEKELLRQVIFFKEVLTESASSHDPSHLANYCYSLAKNYHRFYHDNSILKADSAEAKSFRVHLSKLVAEVLERAMNLLGIEMPRYM